MNIFYNLMASSSTNSLYSIFYILLMLLDQIHHQSPHAKQLHPMADPTKIVRQRLTRDALLPCKWAKYASDDEQIQWWYREAGRKGRLIGSVDGSTGLIIANWTNDGSYRIERNGSLTILNVRRALVERYECVDRQWTKRDAIYFRLDFSNWYALKPFALSYGSLIAAAAFCAASFVLNIVWIFVRWIVLRWIRRTERLSRVRAMLVAMEKYRQKQMESIHEGYSRRMSQIRENYHNQMEALRQSYAESADRFRDYKQAKKDNVQQHLDNYSHQIGRLREYGSRRVDQIWESYSQSISAVRTFTLEQRMKILGQYKVKQRYVNKLLEAIATETNVDLISKKEAAIRDVLGEDVPPPPIPPFWPNPSQQQNGGGRNGASGKLVPIPRSASYYSLPEFVIRDEDEEEVISNNGLMDEDDEQNQQPSTSTASSTFPPPLPRQTMPQATLGSSAALLETSTASTANNYSSMAVPPPRSVRFGN